MFRFLGRGWKTVSGATLWALAHIGVLQAIGVPDGITDAVTKVGAALAALGLAHKVERADPTTLSR